MKTWKRQFKAESLLALLLFAVFSACVLLVLLFGAGAYQRLSDRSQVTYDYRTASQYLATRLRQAEGEIRILDDGSTQGLTLCSTIGGQEYRTYIYCWDGWLRELFADSGLEFSPEFGEPLFNAEELRVRRGPEDGILAMDLTLPGGRTVQVYLADHGVGRW